MIYVDKYPSPLGEIMLASNGRQLTGVWFGGEKFNADNVPKDYKEQELPIFAQTKRWLDIYFSGKEPNFMPPLNMDGISPFRKRVWEIMLTIPYGKTLTYGQIAKQIEKETGKRVSAQAVGGAVGHNSIGIVIPCHRVVGTNGSLTGYAGGIDKKVWLLTFEKVDMSKFFIPTRGTVL